MKYNITKDLVRNLGLERYLALPLHYKIKLRNNYKITLINRNKRKGE